LFESEVGAGVVGADNLLVVISILNVDDEEAIVDVDDSGNYILNPERARHLG